MMPVQVLTVLAHAIPEVTPRPTIAVALLIAVLSAGLGLGVLLTILLRRRRDALEIEGLSQRYQFQSVTDAVEAKKVRGFVDRLFGEGPKIGRMLRQQSNGLDFHLVTMRVPLFRVERDGTWDDRMQESQEKLIVFVSGFDRALPPFRLMPNSWALTTVRGKEANVMHDIEPFGFRNYVIADDRDWVLHLLTGEAMHRLRRNRQLTLDSRREYLAFYLQDERPQPPNLPAFVEQALHLAAAIRDRNARWRHADPLHSA